MMLARLLDRRALFGWTPLESLFTGAIIAISSTTIIVKAFDEQRIGGQLRELVVGILIVEDLIAILLMADADRGRDRRGPVGRAARDDRRPRSPASWSALLVVGMLMVPRAMRAIVAARPARDDAGREHRDLLRHRAARPGVRLLGRARRVPRRLAGRRVGRREEDRAPDRAGARRVRGDLLRLGRHADRSRAGRAATGARCSCSPRRRDRRQDRERHARRLPHRQRPAHRRCRPGMSLAQIGEFSFIIAGLGLSLRRHRRLPLPGRGRGLGADDARSRRG